VCHESALLVMLTGFQPISVTCFIKLHISFTGVNFQFVLSAGIGLLAEYYNLLMLRAGLTTEEAQELLRRHGRNELPSKSVPKWKVFLMQLYQPMPIMIWIAAITEGEQITKRMSCRCI
jgi:hypothetical protein